jgi:hypothetical protein
MDPALKFAQIILVNSFLLIEIIDLAINPWKIIRHDTESKDEIHEAEYFEPEEDGLERTHW